MLKHIFLSFTCYISLRFPLFLRENPLERSTFIMHFKTNFTVKFDKFIEIKFKNVKKMMKSFNILSNNFNKSGKLTEKVMLNVEMRTRPLYKHIDTTPFVHV